MTRYVIIYGALNDHLCKNPRNSHAPLGYPEFHDHLRRPAGGEPRKSPQLQPLRPSRPSVNPPKSKTLQPKHPFSRRTPRRSLERVEQVEQLEQQGPPLAASVSAGTGDRKHFPSAPPRLCERSSSG